MAENQQNTGGASPPQHPSPLPPGGAGGGQQQDRPADPAARLAGALDGGRAGAGGAAGSQQQPPPKQPSGEPTGQQPAQQSPAAPPPEGYVKASDVQRLVQEQLQQAMQGYRETKAADDARASYQTLKMPDLPEAYRNQLGTDPTQWGKQEQQIRQQYRADFKAAGGTVPDVGGGRPGGVPASQATAAGRPADKSPVARLGAALDQPKG